MWKSRAGEPPIKRGTREKVRRLFEPQNIPVFDYGISLFSVTLLTLYKFQALRNATNRAMTVITSHLPTFHGFHACLLICGLLCHGPDIGFNFGNSNSSHDCFVVYRFHPQKQRHNQQQGHKGSNQRTFLSKIATFCRRFVLFLGFHVCSRQLEIRVNYLLLLRRIRFRFPLSGTYIDRLVKQYWYELFCLLSFVSLCYYMQRSIKPLCSFNDLQLI